MKGSMGLMVLWDEVHFKGGSVTIPVPFFGNRLFLRILMAFANEGAARVSFQSVGEIF